MLRNPSFNAKVTSTLLMQMAYELHGLLAGNVSIVTGENIKPSYGGDDESFLRKVITPIYRVIDKVICLIYLHFLPLQFSFL